MVMTQVKMTRDLERALLESLEQDGGWFVGEYVASNYRLGIKIFGLTTPADMSIHLPGGALIDFDIPLGIFMPWRWRIWWAVRKLRVKAERRESVDPADVISLIRHRSGSLVVPV